LCFTPSANHRLLTFILLRGDVVFKCGLCNDPRPARFEGHDFPILAHLPDGDGVAFQDAGCLVDVVGLHDVPLLK